MGILSKRKVVMGGGIRAVTDPSLLCFRAHEIRRRLCNWKLPALLDKHHLNSAFRSNDTAIVEFPEADSSVIYTVKSVSPRSLVLSGLVTLAL